MVAAVLVWVVMDGGTQDTDDDDDDGIRKPSTHSIRIIINISIVNIVNTMFVNDILLILLFGPLLLPVVLPLLLLEDLVVVIIIRRCR
jgi:hypothetical protein